jgi:cytochrome c1
MNYVHYKDLKKIGYEWAEIEEIASFYEYDGGFDDEGEPKVRKGQPIDIFKKPYPNEKYARFVNFGALPPDLTLMAKKRKGGVNYINSFLKGFEETPNQGEKISYDKTYNPYFPSRQTMMPPPLIEGMIEYEGKIKPTLKQMRKDVSAFLMWTANPNLEKRYSLGYKVLLYSFLLTLLLYLLQKAVWSDLKKEA